ncbi:MAG: preprotein translocase subunit SecG [Candidatus Lustribacter sp.]|jgi:preprotein translocase subunit SecG
MFTALLAAVTAAAKAPAATTKLTQQQLQQIQQQLQQQAAQQNLVVQPHSPLALHAPWLTHTLAGLFIVAAISMIGLLAVQTTKQEGLSGTIGGRVDSAYRGRLGFEGQIARVTGIVAITFVVIATLVSLTGI